MVGATTTNDVAAGSVVRAGSGPARSGSSLEHEAATNTTTNTTTAAAKDRILIPSVIKRNARYWGGVTAEERDYRNHVEAR